MSEKMKSAFIVPYEYEELFSELSDEETGQIFRAMFAYEKNLIKPNFTDRLLKTLWAEIERNLNKLREKYNDKRSETSADNGRLGGRPKRIKPNKPNKNLNNLNGTNDNDYVNDNDCDKEDISKQSDSLTDKQQSAIETIKFHCESAELDHATIERMTLMTERIVRLGYMQINNCKTHYSKIINALLKIIYDKEFVYILDGLDRQAENGAIEGKIKNKFNYIVAALYNTANQT